MWWAFAGGAVDVAHGRSGRLDAGAGAEMRGMTQERVRALHLTKATKTREFFVFQCSGSLRSRMSRR
jgi:hypothetical protein